MDTLSRMYENDTEIPDCPTWADGFTFADAAGVCQGGCASGAWMPAVTYHRAAQIMAEHGDDVLDYLDDGSIVLESGDSWAGFAVKVLSLAVETLAVSVFCAVENGDLLADDDDDA